jgi:hypothetical protein
MGIIRRSLGLAGLAALLAAPAGAVPVDLEIVIAVDVSGSVDPSEFVLQRDAYVAAFQNPAIQAAIAGGQIGAIAATVVYWTGTADVSGLGTVNLIEQVVPWTLIDGAASANAFATAIAGTDARLTIDLGGGAFLTTGDPNNPLQGSGATGVARALSFSGGLLDADNGFEGARTVIDISGDGFENVDHDPAGCSVPAGCGVGHLNAFLIVDPDLHFAATAAARDAVVANGHTINGLPILTDFPSGSTQLDVFFYTPYVIGGPGAFSLASADFSELDTAILAKLEAEIVPEPATGLLLLVGLAACARRRV